nr:ABC transporter permease [Zongyangia hominis]
MVRFGHGVVTYLKENLAILCAFVVMCVALAIMSPVFLSVDNILNVLRQVTVNCNLALGLTMCIIINGIDLSVGSVVAISGTLAAGFISNNGMNVWLAILIAFLIGVVMGICNGLIIAYTGMPPFVVTLAMMNIGRGAAYVYANGQPIRCFVDEFNFWGVGYILGIPVPVIISAILFIIMTLVLTKSKFGRHLYAVGGNEEAAKFSGISIKKVKITVYTLSGIFASLSGIVLAARMYSGQPSAGNGFELDAIAASVLGGVSFLGGVGKLGGTIIGVLVIGILSNGLNLMNVNSFWQYIVKGLIILAAVYLDIVKKSRQKF